jgi:hypothetical protein
MRRKAQGAAPHSILVKQPQHCLRCALILPRIPIITPTVAIALARWFGCFAPTQSESSGQPVTTKKRRQRRNRGWRRFLVLRLRTFGRRVFSVSGKPRRNLQTARFKPASVPLNRVKVFARCRMLRLQDAQLDQQSRYRQFRRAGAAIDDL